VTEERFGNLAEVVALQEKCLEIARRNGDREGEWFALGNLTASYLATGRWDEIMDIVAELPPGLETQALGLHANVSEIARFRGDVELARGAVEKAAALADSVSLQDRTVYLATRAGLLFAEGRFGEIVAELEKVLGELDADTGSVWLDLAIAEAALAGGSMERARDALDVAKLAQPSIGPLIHAQATRFRASVAAWEGDANRADASFKQAAAAFREYDMPFYLACTEQEHAEWLVSVGREEEAEALVAEVRPIFQRLRATPWLERADALAARLPEASSVPG
jgi:tetratricopeptide (TPR) repeat protein